MNYWMITVPKDRIGEFLIERDRVKTTGDWKHFRVSARLRSPKEHDRLYVVYDGKIRGYMPIIGLKWCDGFTCTSTGEEWEAGHYLVGKCADYEEIYTPIFCKGFQGVRRVDFEKFPQLREYK